MHNRTYCLFTFLFKGKVLGMFLLFITGNWLRHTLIYLYTPTHILRETETERKRKGGRRGTIKRGANRNSNLRYFLLIYSDKREDAIMDYI